MATDHVDVLIVGAGLSGIGAARHLQATSPQRRYAILEARDAIGGTWDLFRYPGIRSDSDMHTLGYAFRPWTDAKAIADGPAILEYVRDTAREADIERHIRFGHRVVRAEWSTPDACWTVTAERTDTGEQVRLTCAFLFMCSGYYRYDQGYTPELPGLDRFQGRVVHPQHWPEDLDHRGKRVVVIGSGATAVTIVPAVAGEAEHVTMLQRSPTYIVSLPAKDPIANALRRVLPEKAAYAITRWKNVAMQAVFFQLSRRAPKVAKAFVRQGVKRSLPGDFDLRHFTPSYEPWDQRVCLVPDGDLFEALSAGTASIVTDRIATFTEGGIRLESGRELEADVVVTATGLNLLALGGAEIAVDGRAVELSETVGYKGMMLSDVPNMAMALGYTNASWTLKCDLTCEWVCRLLAHMDEHGYAQATPRQRDPGLETQPFIDLKSGYVLRALDRFPRQGTEPPWRLHQNYLRDILMLRREPIEDGTLELTGASREARRTERVAA